MSAEKQLYHRSFGRIKSRKLSQNKEYLYANLLPSLRIDIAQNPTDISEFFGSNYSEYHLEIGFGAGEHLVARAKQNPHIGYIGAEPFINGVASCLHKISQENITNIRIFDQDVRLLLEKLPNNSLDKIYILFADPWPKRAHFNRRLISKNLLDMLSRVAKYSSELVIATDHSNYANWILHHINYHPKFEWQAKSKSDWQIMPKNWIITRYQQKALVKQQDTCYIIANNTEK